MTLNTENFPCPSCRESIAYDPRLGGQTGKCPGCGEAFPMPETELSTLLKIRDYLYVIRLTLILLALFIVYWLLTHS